jgi:hypothetical protein
MAFSQTVAIEMASASDDAIDVRRCLAVAGAACLALLASACAGSSGLLEVHDVSKHFGGVRALIRASLKVAAGTHHG